VKFLPLKEIKHNFAVFVGQSNCVWIVLLFNSRIGRSQVQARQFNASEFNFLIIIRISAQVINKISKIQENKKKFNQC
jgi:hypothetical protein